MAKLYFRYGAMNSGKSTALLQVAHNYKERNLNPFIIKPAIDLKGGSTIVSRTGMKSNIQLIVPKEMNLLEEIPKFNEIEKIDCILVDEAQFLTNKQIDELFALTLNGTPVIAYGLRNDFKTELFPGSARLLSLAHTIEELKTICRCGKKATLNGRKKDNNWVNEGEQIAIDEITKSITYESLCGNCYNDFIKEF